ncbi:hypothetical protein ACKKBG_A07095 [Auxenochlorella protothecoides x Auxenochlorella symbiontica]
MGKHNGKSRKSGLSVGQSLVNRAKREGRTAGAAAHMYTTDLGPDNNMQSVIERNDLDEMMAMATLADKDFSAERQNVVVISTGSVAPRDTERAEAERSAAEERHRHRLTIPRRPSWDEGTTPAALDAEERASFLAWRRDLALLEGEELLVLTPFEKNLQVWRQLWRVLERSDVLVQVVDARDPLTYACPDLDAYAHELHATKHSLLLLNKADLLPPALRSAWADYFQARGIRHAFWSAKAAAEAEAEAEAEEAASGIGVARRDQDPDPRAALLSVDGLLDLLHRTAQEAVAEAALLGVPRGAHGDRLVVGLTGYPNVGKSSTINALFGSKKTAVAPTPGKTKHFQTLNVTDDLTLCDCPGLVMPQYANSKAEMVAAGVIPIDRLTDVRAPVGAIALRISRRQFSSAYSLHLRGEGHPDAVEVLRALALSRGWVVGSGLPDEVRAGRRILKDYIDGKLMFCKAPPGAARAVRAVAAALAHGGMPEALACSSGAPALEAPSGGGQEEASTSGEEDSEEEEGPGVSAGAGAELDLADLELLEELKLQAQGQKPSKPVRAAHKFHKKAARSKGTRGIAVDLGTSDGAMLQHGKRGGLVRIVSDATA